MKCFVLQTLGFAALSYGLRPWKISPVSSATFKRGSNTLALRLDTAEGAIAVLQNSFVNQQGVSLRWEVQSISQVLTQAVEALNRLEPELLRLLRWRERFTSSLQWELDALGRQFSVAGAQLDIVRLDELD